MTLSVQVRRLLLCATLLAGAGARTNAQTAGANATPAAKGTVRTDTFWSQSLGVQKEVRIYLPPSYTTNATRRFPVLVYLHGLGGDEKNWTVNGKLDLAMDSLIASGKPEAIVVMPDGDDGWWTTANMFADTPGCRADTTRKESSATYCVPWLHYDDYVARDLVSYIDRQYRTIKNRNSRGIAGLSMGGYGAVTIALAYPEVFAAAASHSGVLSPRYLGPKPFVAPPTYGRDTIGLKTASGGLWRTLRVAFGLDTMGWIARDPGRMALRAKTLRTGPLPALRLDCGVSDPYIEENRDFHATLTALGVSHEYAEWPGVHDWNYWRTHVPESLVFLLSHVQTTATSR
ncbi:MAG: alpha/beta hydrolase family protein [Gemmatimonas sp.]